MNTLPQEPYLILSTDRVALGFRVRGEQAAELLDKYSPTSILPDAWTAFPVARYVPFNLAAAWFREDVLNANRAS